MASKENLAISKRFKVLRTNVLDLTQKQMADELDTTQANISQIEAGDCLPTGNFISRIAERFPDVNFNWLIYNEGAPRRSENKIQSNVLSKELEKSKEDNRRLLKVLETLTPDKPTSSKKKK